ncbi:hypothetical protein Cgig2_029947 [Carnegiea gigantea]|uniref:Protein-S-isoprenylcysteine O-methyltransferase n=1 Tax=Carnegiea gigantea TaxID=171969 RepID=A0A9Q1JLS0_9CARY|nr:hypothetical protein Cgig2_029947 [Carnegiea gigantea]
MEVFHNTASRQLSQMFIAIFFFHISEFLLTIAIHGRRNVTLQSLLISKQYMIAMLFSVLEYLVEYSFFPGLKEHWWLSNLGLALVLTGEIIRKIAIVIAGRAFTHIIRTYREEHHRLIMLLNPISTVAFAIVVWRFFAGRIPYEENYLKRFFGTQYVEYARRMWADEVLWVSCGYST